MQLARPFITKPWNAVVSLGAGDTTKVIKAAPGAGLKLVVTKWHYRSVTSAAQVLTLGDGTITVDSLPASIAAGTRYESPTILDIGIQLTANTAFSITPAAAGPAGVVIAEGYIINA